MDTFFLLATSGFLLVVSGLAALATLTYCLRLRAIAAKTVAVPILSDSIAEPGLSSQAGNLASIAVIIPAYNEAENIQACVIAALQAAPLAPEQVGVWVVDDQSQDDTLTIVQHLQSSLNDPRLHILVGQDRPTQQIWLGKNWACTQAAEQTQSDFLLFLDADVQLKPGAIATALDLMQREQIDLLSGTPQIVCGCLAEWLVQPIIIGLLSVGYDPEQVNDPSNELAFASGQFMLFRRTAYEQLGGHRSVASQVVEDVELGRRVKQQGLTLKYILGRELASVQMYRSWGSLWEGWTKNLYLGSHRNLRLTVKLTTTVLLVCTIPWIGLAIVLAKAVVSHLNWLDLGTLILALVGSVVQYPLRQALERLTAISTRYWWLTGLGGMVVAAILIASIIKTETGWGWTWRGRSLKLPDEVAS